MRALTFDEYQRKLSNQEKYFQMLLYSKKEQKFFLYRPKSKSIYGTETQKSNYYKALRGKLKINKTNSNNKVSFVTLTYDSKLYSPVQVLRRCKHDIQNFLKLVRYYVGKINYFWIVELTKKDYVHFHILVKEYIPAKIISQCWLKTTGSIITHVKGVSRTVASRYISKYVGDSAKLSNHHARFLYDNDFARIYSNSKGFFMQRTRERGAFALLGLITNPFCAITAQVGGFYELDEIALNILWERMTDHQFGYIQKYYPD